MTNTGPAGNNQKDNYAIQWCSAGGHILVKTDKHRSEHPNVCRFMNLNVNDHELLIVQMFKMYHYIIADNIFASKQQVLIM